MPQWCETTTTSARLPRCGYPRHRIKVLAMREGMGARRRARLVVLDRLMNRMRPHRRDTPGSSLRPNRPAAGSTSRRGRPCGRHWLLDHPSARFGDVGAPRRSPPCRWTLGADGLEERLIAPVRRLRVAREGHSGESRITHRRRNIGPGQNRMARLKRPYALVGPGWSQAGRTQSRRTSRGRGQPAKHSRGSSPVRRDIADRNQCSCSSLRV